MRAAAIDIGTNTVLLTVAERRADGIVALEERATITRLGAGLDASLRIATEALQRTLDCLSDYARSVAALGVDRMDVVGTSALRDARGSEDFLEAAQRILGTRPRVIGGEEEARLTFLGATSDLDLEDEVLVFDVGGGSTELVQGRAGEARVAWWASLDLGSVRLFERHVAGDPPAPSELERVRQSVRSELASNPPLPHSSLVGVAGTVTTLAALALGASRHAPEALHGLRLRAEEVASMASRLAAMPLSERLRLGALDPGRADVIVVGAIMVDEILTWAGDPELRVSDRGVRWGLLCELLG